MINRSLLAGGGPEQQAQGATPNAIRQLDLSLFKSFAFAEKRRVEFRAEAFNAFNTPQFNNPNSSIGFSGVARITSAGSPTVYQRTSRQIQLALKVYF